MKLGRIATLAIAACAAALGGCSGTVPVTPSSIGPDRGPSWMSASATTSHQLLYVSDVESFDVYVYDFPSLQLAGKLTGFDNPQGECSDASGDVWIANLNTDQMLEFAHGGKKVIASLSDPVGEPAGCAIDRTNGDLAVTNLHGFSGSGSVIVYHAARGTPRVYSNSNVRDYYFAAYDSDGNLYANGTSGSNGYLLTVLPHGNTSMPLVTIAGGTIHFPGTVAWRGSTLVLGDQRCKGGKTSCFYELTVSGRTARIKGTTPLSGSCDVAQAWVGATAIAGGDNGEPCSTGSSVERWPYPRGGAPGATAHGPRAPVGATLSSSS